MCSIPLELRKTTDIKGQATAGISSCTKKEDAAIALQSTDKKVIGAKFLELSNHQTNYLEA